MTGDQAYALSKGYMAKLSSGVQTTSYNFNTSTLTCTTVDGNTFDIGISNGMTTEYVNVLDKMNVDADGDIEIEGNKVVTKDDVETTDIDFDNMF